MLFRSTTAASSDDTGVPEQQMDPPSISSTREGEPHPTELSDGEDPAAPKDEL